jgi:hypothetical protein
MKKILMFLVAGALAAGLANAGSETLTCTPLTSGANTPTFSPNTISCPDFNSGTGTLQSVLITLVDGFTGGAGSTNTFSFTYTISDTDFPSQGTGSNTCTGTGGASGFTCVDQVTGGYTGSVGYYPLGTGAAYSGGDLGNYVGVSTFTLGTIQGAVVAGGLGGSGDLSENAEVTYVYTNGTSPTPEPATLTMFGAGLLALGVVTRKRTKKS